MREDADPPGRFASGRTRYNPGSIHWLPRDPGGYTERLGGPPGCAVAQEMTRFELAHLLRDFVDRKVDGCVEVVGGDRCLQRDVVCAAHDDLGELPVAMLLKIEHDVRFDDFRVIQMQLAQLLDHMLIDRLGYHEVSAIHSNRNVHVSCLHSHCSFRWARTLLAQARVRVVFG